MVSQKESDMTEQLSLGLVTLPLYSFIAASLPHPNIRFTLFFFLVKITLSAHSFKLCFLLKSQVGYCLHIP